MTSLFPDFLSAGIKELIDLNEDLSVFRVKSERGQATVKSNQNVLASEHFRTFSPEEKLRNIKLKLTLNP